MKKRCLLLLSALVCLLSFVACGTTTEEKYGDYTSAQIESAMESQVTSLEGLSSEELAQYVAVYEAQAEQSDEEGISLYEKLESEHILDPEELVIAREATVELIDDIRSRLSKMENAVLDHYLDGLGYTEIADIMGKQPKAIDNAIQRIRKKALG
jgi:DNA-binding NarL/FixJ family response regulator